MFSHFLDIIYHGGKHIRLLRPPPHQYTERKITGMQYHSDLQDLIDRDPASREYFNTLPLGIQLTLQRHDGLIHSPQDLSQYADFFSRLKLNAL